jgi:hypothetical protein
VRKGDRITIAGVEYAVTRVAADERRGQIDLIAVDEARARRDDLNELLGEP